MVFGNARVFGNAWVCGTASVCGTARVSGDAWVSGNARVFKETHVLMVGPIGSRNATTTFFRSNEANIMVACGCFSGTIDEFLEAVNKTHENNKHGKVYRAAIELAKLQIDLDG